MSDERPWIRDRAFYVSPHNHDPSIREAFAGARQPARAQLFDSTVRKVLITPGLMPTVAGMLRVAEAVERLGMEHFTLNIHWWGEERVEALEWAVAEAVLRRDFEFSTTITLDNAWADDWKEKTSFLGELGLTEPTFVIQTTREDSGERSGAEVHERIELLITESIGLGMRPAVMLTDIGRAQWTDTVALADTAAKAGAARLDLADSGSSLSHHGMRVLLTNLRAQLTGDVPFLVHIHDDFGLGTAAALETIACGENVEVSLNGISDRAGFPALEEVAVALESMYGISTGLDMGFLAEACAITAQESYPPHPYKALSGDQAFMLDLPYAVAPTLKAGKDVFPPVWTCVDPRWIGTTSRMPWLRQFLTGPVLAAKLASLDLPSDDESVSRARTMLTQHIVTIDRYPMWLDEEAVDEMCRALLG